MERRIRKSSFCGSFIRSFPSTITAPSVGRSRRLIQRTRVDFPAPDRPMIPKISPSSMVRLIPSSATIFPAALSKVLPMFLISIIRSNSFLYTMLKKQGRKPERASYPKRKLYCLRGYDTRRDSVIHTAHHHIHHHYELCHIPVSLQKIYKEIVSHFFYFVNSFFTLLFCRLQKRL